MWSWRVLMFVLLVGSGLPQEARAVDYYVSQAGSDANAGTSPGRAWQTLGHVSSQTFLPGDRILLRGEEKFGGSLAFTSQGGEENGKPRPITLASYGRGRATIQAGNGTAVLIRNAGGWLVKDLVLVGSGREINQSSGLHFRNEQPNSVRLNYIRIENIDASGFGQHGILIEGAAADNSQSGYEDVRITRCAAHDNAHTGMYVTGVYDMKTNLYANHNVTVAHCTAYDNPGDPKFTANHSGSGIFLEDVDGGVIERCVARNNGALCPCPAGGPIGIWATSANNITIQFCESHHNHTSAQSLDGGGFDFDGGVTNSVLQYNYSHDNDGAGYLIYNYPYAPHTFRGNTVRYNISQDDGRKHHYSGILAGSDVRDCVIHNNTIFVRPAAGATPCALIVAGRNMRYCNNLLVTTGGVPILEGSGEQDMVLRGNDYWSSGGAFKIVWNGKAYGSLNAFQIATLREIKTPNGGAAVGLQADPLLTRPGDGGTLDNADRLRTLDAYRLRPGSPLINAGVHLPIYLGVRVGQQDFYGTPLPQGRDYDIGVHERK